MRFPKGQGPETYLSCPSAIRKVLPSLQLEASKLPFLPMGPVYLTALLALFETLVFPREGWLTQGLRLGGGLGELPVDHPGGACLPQGESSWGPRG